MTRKQVRQIAVLGHHHRIRVSGGEEDILVFGRLEPEETQRASLKAESLL